jgi:cyanophycinase
MPAKLAPDRQRGLIVASGVIGADSRARQLLVRLLALLGPQPRVVLVATGENADDGEGDI